MREPTEFDLITALARPEIQTLAAYQSAAGSGGLRLHANEAPWRQDCDRSRGGLNRYPQPWPDELVGRLAGYYGVPGEWVAPTRGSDDGIDLLVRIFCRPGEDAVLLCPPTFGMYRVAADIQGAAVVEVPLDPDDGFSLRTRAVIEAGESSVRLVFLCSPNNPTGNSFSADDIETLCSDLAGKALVVVDEAYVEFSSLPSLIPVIRRYANLAVLRTFSKAHALAGARLGAVVARPELTGLLRRVLPPYALPTETIEVALRTLDEAYPEVLTARVEGIAKERARMTRALLELDRVIEVWPSDANFLLVKFDDAPGVVERTGREGVLIRDFSSSPWLPGCVRISIGSAGQNDRIIGLLQEVANG